MLGKGQARVQQALDTLRAALPFRLRGIDSDNGSEFINHHLYRYCQAQEIQFTRARRQPLLPIVADLIVTAHTRGRPYKKDDNAHIEQKNWTHVRKLVGYVRYDSPAALAALHQLYDDLRLFQNLWLPSVKLEKKTRVGRRLRRQYDAPQTPLAEEHFSHCAHRPSRSSSQAEEVGNRINGAMMHRSVTFSNGLTGDGVLNADTRRIFEDLARRPGWYVTVSTLLDYLRSRRQWRSITKWELMQLQLRWLAYRLRARGASPL